MCSFYSVLCNFGIVDFMSSSGSDSVTQLDCVFVSWFICGVFMKLWFDAAFSFSQLSKTPWLVLVLGILFSQNDQKFVIGLLSLVMFAMHFTKLKFPLLAFLLLPLFLCLTDDDCPYPLRLFCHLMKFPLFRLVGSLLPTSVALGSIDHRKKKYWAVVKKPNRTDFL